MTGRSGPGEASTDAALARAATHGAELHHLAAMLTGSTDTATALVALTFITADDGDGAERLKTDLVRTYLRTAPRRAERAEAGRPQDAAEVLRRLRPRARAAAALRLVESWDPARVARAVRVRPHRVDALVPSTPGLAVALAAVADQHALAGPDLDRELTDEIRAAAPPPTAAAGRRRWARLAAAAVPLAVLAGWAVVSDGPGSDQDPSAVTAGPDGGPRTDLTAAGWELDEDGEPPGGAMGLSLARQVTVEAGDPPTEVSWPTNTGASFAVLWCDMPPAQDANLTVPSGTLAVGSTVVDLRCAGRDGTPPVTDVAAVPPGGTALLEVDGDLPPDGTATLGVYNETDSVNGAPLPRGSLVDAPPAPVGSLVLDPADTVPAPAYGEDRRVWRAAAVEIGHDSAVRVWVGRTGAVSVSLDGVPVTDDGDISSVGAWLAAGGGRDGSDGPSVDWRTQRPDLRWGRWLAYVPGEVRTFALPDSVRPARGERATVSVEVVTENMAEHVQVVVLDAAAGQVDTSPVRAIADPPAPSFVLGHRLVGAWTLPQDGQLRELDGAQHAAGELVALGTWTDDSPAFFLGQGAVVRDGQAVEVRYDSSVAAALGMLRHGWTEALSPAGGALSASAPAAPGQPDSLLLLYTPVPHEAFDFAAAAVPPGSWPTADYPAPESQYPGAEPLAVLGPDDLEDGRATVDLDHDGLVAARVTTEGKGRVRFLLDDFPADNLWNTDGWWSSWTDRPVVSEVDLSYSEGMGERALTVEVEGYDEFTVEVLAPHDLRLGP